MPVRSREIHALSTRIQLPVMRKLLSVMDGQHSALRQGRGWEFMDLAPYQPGDDVREIDWAATARTGSPVIKRHEATANLQVMLVVDTGREMGALALRVETEGRDRPGGVRGDRLGCPSPEETRSASSRETPSACVSCPPARATRTRKRCCAASRRTSPWGRPTRTSPSCWRGPGPSPGGAASS